MQDEHFELIADAGLQCYHAIIAADTPVVGIDDTLSMVFVREEYAALVSIAAELCRNRAEKFLDISPEASESVL